MTAETQLAVTGIAADLASALTYYRERLGWPVSINARDRCLLLRTGDLIDALILPAALGQPVAAELCTSMMSGPISTDDDKWRWTFFTECCRRENPELPPDLRSANVRTVPKGGHVMLPPHPESKLWRQPPEPNRSLPPWSAVVAVARRVLDRLT